MARDWVVVGDATDSGGRVITGSPFTDIDGKPVAREGDRAVCPAHKGTFPIVAGCDVRTIVDGRPVALDRAVLACGCRVIAAEQRHVFLEESADDAFGQARLDSARTSFEPRSSGSELALERTAAGRSEYALQFLVRDQLSGAPLAGARYAIKLETGAILEGVTDAGGRTETVRSPTPELATVRVLYCCEGEKVMCASPDPDPCGC